MLHRSCFVTPSFDRDFERCKLLVDSRRVCAGHIPHFIVVDPHDVALFSQLADHNTVIVDSRELLDNAFHKLWGRNGWWISSRTLPLRGWMSQQIRKLAMPRLVDDAVLINLDSDVVFIRPFDTSMLWRQDKLGLFEVDYRNDEIVHWANVAGEMTGCTVPAVPNNYVGMLIPWWRSNVVALVDQIEQHTGRPWQEAVARRRSFSEYMTYGVYARSIGLERASHFSDGRRLVQTSWHEDTGSDEGLARLFDPQDQDTVAVMVHSKDGIDPQRYRRHVQRMWDRVA